MPAQRSNRQISRSLLWSFFPAVLIILGVLFTLWIQRFSATPYNATTSLDTLLTQQLAQQLRAGQLPPDLSLKLTSLDWVQTLWQQTLHPLALPAAYEIGSDRFLATSFAFPLLSAPLFALLGSRGLLLIPLLALWLIWVRCWQISQRAGWGTGTLCLLLVALIFASPLSLYSGIFSAHTLTVALAFWGITQLIYPVRIYPSRSVKSSKAAAISPLNLISSGLLIALSAWFRPEFVSLVVAVSLLALIGWVLPKWQIAPAFSLRQAIALILTMACTLALLLVLNYAIYGYPFGTQLIYLQPSQLIPSYQQLAFSISRHFPLVLVIGIAALLSPALRRPQVKINPIKKFSQQSTRQYFQKLGIRTQADASLVTGRYFITLSILYALGSPLFVQPLLSQQQWGPPSLLLLIPLLTCALAEQLRPALYRQSARRLVLIGSAIALIFGIHLNTVRGGFTVYQDQNNHSLPASYSLIAPALTGLQQQPQTWIATSTPAVAHQLWSALPNKTFFSTDTPEKVKLLATTLLAQNEREFLYICDTQQSCTFPQTPATDLQLENGSQINLFYLDTYGAYPVYRAQIATP